MPQGPGTYGLFQQPQGFGGSGALALLQGVAQGNIERKQREQEAQRQAVLRRLQQQQVESMQQQRELAEEQAERTREQQQEREQAREAVVNRHRQRFIEQGDDPETAAEKAQAYALAEQYGFQTPEDRRAQETRRELLEQQREQMAANTRRTEEDIRQLQEAREQQQQAVEAAAQNVKQHFIDRGMSPSEAEERSLNYVRAVQANLPTRQGLLDREANRDQVQTSTSVNYLRGQQISNEIDAMNRQAEVYELLGDPGFVRRADDPVLEDATVIRATKSAHPDMDEATIGMALRAVRGDEPKQPVNPLAEGRSGIPGHRFRPQQIQELRQYAEEHIEHHGDVQTALADARQQLRDMPEEDFDRRRRTQAIISLLESRIRRGEQEDAVNIDVSSLRGGSMP